MATRLVCTSKIVLASWLWGSVLASRRCRFVAKTMTVRWGWGLNLRHDQIGEGWAQLEIVLLGFEDGGFGIYDFFFLIYGFFMLNFLGLWILFAGGFVVDWKMRKSGFELWFCISEFCSLRKSTARFMFVFLLEIDLCLCLVDKKGQENASKSGHVFLCLKCGSMFFGVLVKDEHRSWFFFIIIF